MLEKASEELVWPEVGHNAEMDSLMYHAKLSNGISEEPPISSVRNLTLDLALDHFSSLKHDLPEDFMTFSHFRRVVEEKIEWNSSPGVPYLYSTPNNRQLFEVVDGKPSEKSLHFMWEKLQRRIQNRDSDPIRLFIKQEPHTKKKQERKSWRLISSVSVLDQIIDHMLFDHMNDKATDTFIYHSCQVGWTPYLGGWKFMPQRGYKASDVSGWDWSVRIWLIDLYLQLRLQLCLDGPHKKLWEELVIWRFKMLYEHPSFITSGGLLFRQLFPGIQKSGCVDTIVGNSIMRWLLHCRVCIEIGLYDKIRRIPFMKCMGDDGLQEYIELLEKEYINALSKYCHLKYFDDAVEFAGYEFHGYRVEPSYIPKHAYNLLHCEEKNLDDMASSYALLYHRSQYRDWFRQMFVEAGCDIPSLRNLDMIFDGVDDRTVPGGLNLEN